MGDRLAAWANNGATRLFGPVFALEATRIGRRTSTFLVRWLYLLALTGILGLFYLNWATNHRPTRGVMPPSVMASFAGDFFWVYAVTQFLVVTALTPAFTAAAITEEKERKSLDDLLTTDLTGREIVFGKLAVRVGVLMSFVLAGVPILALLEFFGGIEPEYLLVAVGMTLVTVLSLSAIGAAASVQMPRTRESVLLAYAMPVAYLIASTWWLSDVRQAPSGAGGSLPVGGVTITGTTPAEVFASGNVFEAVRHLDRPGQPSGGTDTLEAAAWYGGFHLAIAAAGFAFAAFRVRSCVRTPAGARGQPTSPLKVAFYWLIDRRTVARKHPPVAQDAVWWREVWVEPGSSGGLFRRLLTLSIIAAVGYPLWVMCYTYLIVGGLRSQLGMTEIGAFQFSVRIWVGMVTGGLGSLMLLRAAVQGATAVAGERDRDTWISLLATPLTGAEILRGKWAGCVWGQRNGLYLLSTVAVIGVLTGSVNPVALGVTACLFLIYLRAFAWVGLWCSLAARNTRAAIARAVALALLMGGGFWLPLGCCSAGMAMGTSGEGLGHFLLFLAGWTPLLNLGGIPLLKFEYFEKVNDGFMSGFCGLVVGSVAWWFVGTFYCQLALARLQLDTNRERPPWGRDATAWPF